MTAMVNARRVSNSGTRIRSATLMLIYWAILHITYVKMIAPTYSYLGFQYRTPEPLLYTTIVILVLFLTLCMPTRLERPSSTVIWLNFLVVTAPSMIVPQFTPILAVDAAFEFGLGVAISWVLLLWLTSDRVRPRLSIDWAVPRSSDTWLLAIGVLSIGITGLLVLVLEMRPEIVSLTEVTSIRFGYREALVNAPLGTAYLLLGTANVLNPYLLAKGLISRRLSPLVIGGLGQLLIYSVTGYKTVLLSVPAIILLVLWLRGKNQASGSGIVAAVTGIMGVALAVFLAFGNAIIASFFVMRFVISPGNLAAAYVAFFSEREQLYWGQSLLSWVIDYPYHVSPNYLVGEVLRGSIVTSANAGIFADGYMNMRWAGVLIECLVLVVFLWVLDAAAEGLPIAVSSAVVFIPAYYLANASIFTALTSQGLLLALFVLLMLPRSTDPPDSAIAGTTGLEGSESS